MIKFKNTNLTVTFSKKHLGENIQLKQEQEKYLNAKEATKIKILGTIYPTAPKQTRL